jgi:hypothetical protein
MNVNDCHDNNSFKYKRPLTEYQVEGDLKPATSKHTSKRVFIQKLAHAQTTIVAFSRYISAILDADPQAVLLYNSQSQTPGRFLYRKDACFSV